MAAPPRPARGPEGTLAGSPERDDSATREVAVVGRGRGSGGRLAGKGVAGSSCTFRGLPSAMAPLDKGKQYGQFTGGSGERAQDDQLT